MNAKIRIVTLVVSIMCFYLLFLSSNCYVWAEGEPKDANETSALQRKKLELEIKDLEDKKSTWNKAIQILPLLTTFIAVAGLLFTIYKARTDRKQELVTRDEDHIRDDMNQLLSLDPDEETSSGMVSFLLDDLNQLVERNTDRRDTISITLFTFIMDDCNFDKLRHIHLDIESLGRWEDYQKYLINNPNEHDFIMYKYFQSFRHLHDEDKSYFEHIQYDVKVSEFRVEVFTDEIRYLRFLALMRAYTLHLEILEPEAKEKAIEQFQQAMNNSSLTEQYFRS